MLDHQHDHSQAAPTRVPTPHRAVGCRRSEEREDEGLSAG